MFPWYGVIALVSTYLVLGTWGVGLVIGLASILTVLTGEFEREVRALIKYQNYEPR